MLGLFKKWCDWCDHTEVTLLRFTLSVTEWITIVSLICTYVLILSSNYKGN